MTRSRRLMGGLAAATLVLGVAGCGDDDSDGPPTPGTETELDGGEAGTGGDATSTSLEPSGTTGGTTAGATEGNQVPPAG